MLMHHVRSLEGDTLARRMYEEQRTNNWPGLAQETEQICQELEIESVHATRLDARMYRKVVTEAIQKTNEKRLRAQAENKAKCVKSFAGSYGKKSYIKEKSIFEARLHYKARFGMFDFAGNFGNDRRFLKTDWLCFCKEAREEESHILSGSCKIYGGLRKSFGNIDSDNDLVQFFSRVLEERARLEEQEEQEEEEESPSGGGVTAGAASGGSQPSHASLEAHQPS